MRLDEKFPPEELSVLGFRCLLKSISRFEDFQLGIVLGDSGSGAAWRKLVQRGTLGNLGLGFRVGVGWLISCLWILLLRVVYSK